MIVVVCSGGIESARKTDTYTSGRDKSQSNVNLRRRADPDGTDAFERLRTYFEELCWGR